MTHDPLCTTVRNTEMNEVFCNCDLIARVREDERAWLAGTREVDVELARIKSVAHFDDGYAAALRDAVEAVKALPTGSGSRAGRINRSRAVAAIEAISIKRTGGLISAEQARRIGSSLGRSGCVIYGGQR